MSVFDNIEANLKSIAGKVGLTADQVKAIANTFQANLTSNEGNAPAAMDATAGQQGVSVETIREILNLGGGLDSEIGDTAKPSER
ncbi:MAG TPA: hypothetical protein VIJ85_05125 [Rhizomicrobium sp.]